MADSCDISGGCPFCSALGRLASAPYAAVMRLRRSMHRAGVLPSRAAGLPVICVGNITCGGTGKTPMVAWVVRRLTALGRRPAILTRGYRSRGGVSDEATLLAELTGAAVVVNPDRVAGAAKAVADGADVLVMDDGFQHLRLRRDLDIVLIDATDPFGGGLLPVGRGREPLSALRDADAVVITRSDAVSPEWLEALTRRLGGLAPAASLHAAVHEPTKFIDPAGTEHPADALAGKKVFAFCGLARPEAFFRTLERLGADVAGARALADHAAYTPGRVDALCEQARRAGAELLVTTGKDWVKLRALCAGRPVWRLAVEMRIVAGEQHLADRLAAVGSARENKIVSR